MKFLATKKLRFMKSSFSPSFDIGSRMDKYQYPEKTSWNRNITAVISPYYLYLSLLSHHLISTTPSAATFLSRTHLSLLVSIVYFFWNRSEKYISKQDKKQQSNIEKRTRKIPEYILFHFSSKNSHLVKSRWKKHDLYVYCLKSPASCYHHY